MYKLTVNDAHNFEFTEKDVSALDLIETENGPAHLLFEDRGYTIKVLDQDLDRGQYRLRVNGTLLNVTVADALDMLIEKMGFELSASDKVGEIEAPMPGLILDIMVEAGDEVNEGDPLLILEAMKMENVLTSPTNGIVQDVIVKKGESVDKKQVLLNFE